MKRIILCRGGCGSKCPEVCIDEDIVTITNDNCEYVTMNTDQFEILKKKIINREFD